MQALKSLFARRHVQTAAAAPARQPVELPAESLKLVGGGLPRVSGPESTQVDAAAAADQLPRVS